MLKRITDSDTVLMEYFKLDLEIAIWSPGENIRLAQSLSVTTSAVPWTAFGGITNKE